MWYTRTFNRGHIEPNSPEILYSFSCLYPYNRILQRFPFIRSNTLLSSNLNKEIFHYLRKMIELKSKFGLRPRIKSKLRSSGFFFSVSEMNIICREVTFLLINYLLISFFFFFWHFGCLAHFNISFHRLLEIQFPFTLEYWGPSQIFLLTNLTLGFF